MARENAGPAFRGDAPVAAERGMLPDRRELALVAVERTRMPMVITDPRREDNPIVLANRAFLHLTGYGADEVIGRNCRFLQGPDTAAEHIDVIRRGLEACDHHIDVEILNYRKDGSTFWNQLVISAVHDEQGDLLYYFASQKDVSTRREVQRLESAERQLLMEVDHRAMNALALVQSIVALSRTDSVERFSRSIRGRVDALARAHRLLGLSGWSAAPLAELIATEAGASEVKVSGAPAPIQPRLVQPLCLVLHELVDNAREHGALSRPDARASLEWEAASDEIVLHWVESGVPLDPASPPRPGLGLALVRGIVEQQLGGKLTLAWQSDGLRARLAVPLET